MQIAPFNFEALKKENKMKSQINFDTLEYMEALKSSGFTPQQAESLTKATSKAFGQMVDVKQLSTKTDLSQMEMRMYGVIFSMFVAFGFIQHFIK